MSCIRAWLVPVDRTYSASPAARAASSGGVIQLSGNPQAISGFSSTGKWPRATESR